MPLENWEETSIVHGQLGSVSNQGYPKTAGFPVGFPLSTPKKAAAEKT